MTFISTRLLEIISLLKSPLATQPSRRTERFSPERLPAVFRRRASVERVGADVQAPTVALPRRPLQIYVDAQDPRRARMAGSFAEICAQLDHMASHQ